MTKGVDRAEEFSVQVKTLINSISDAQNAFKAKHLSRNTRDDVVELSLVRGMGLFEELLEDLFFLALQSHLGDEVKPVLPVSSPDEASLLVYDSELSGNSRYTTWIPYKDKTLPRARNLLQNGLPFTRLDNRPTETGELRALTLVRNAVAHNSESARTKFITLAKERKYPYARPADYLTSHRQQEMEILVGLTRLVQIARGLGAPTDKASRRFLDPEGLFEHSRVAMPGNYACERCGNELATTDFAPLGHCRQCNRPTSCPSCGKSVKQVTNWKRIDD